MKPVCTVVAWAFLGLCVFAEERSPAALLQVPAGSFQPPARDAAPLAVAAFRLEEHAVTNAAFLEFVLANPSWQKGAVPRVFADEGYLRHWASATEPGPQAPAQSPVTSVSWFAARAYCAWRGTRLPTVAEWELAAAWQPAGTARAEILTWYAEPLSFPLPSVRSTRANPIGIWDLHGLIWEWTEDFDSFTPLSRSGGGEGSSAFFCGGGSLDAADPGDYASFLRFAFRGSLSATHTVAGLGFRCAQTKETAPP